MISNYVGVVPFEGEEAQDKVLADILDEALDALEFSPCTHWACRGYDIEPVHMATCRKCYAMRDVQAVRQTLIFRATEEKNNGLC